MGGAERADVPRADRRGVGKRRATSWASTPTCSPPAWTASPPPGFRPSSTRPPTTRRPCTSGPSATPIGTSAGIVYHTQAERDLVEQVFSVGAKPQLVLGLGVNDPTGAGRPGGEVLGLGDRPYLCYLGRVDEHKGCSMLAEFFARYKERRPGDLALAFVGPVSAKAPDHPDIVVTGTVSEADKWDILAGATTMVSSSAYESFSLVLLEAWTLRVPVLINATCAATMEHCRRSGGGLWFDSYRSFEVAVDRLAGDPLLRGVVGRGRPVLHRPLLPVALDHRPVFEVPRAGGRAGPATLAQRRRVH